MKIKCGHCQKMLPKSAYYKCLYSPRGVRGWCIECTREDNKKEVNRKYGRELYRRDVKKRHERVILYNKKHPDRVSASAIFHYAIKVGNIKKQPCIICRELKVQGHHKDYSKPLNVIWLCSMHHRLVHTGKLKV